MSMACVLAGTGTAIARCSPSSSPPSSSPSSSAAAETAAAGRSKLSLNGSHRLFRACVVIKNQSERWRGRFYASASPVETCNESIVKKAPVLPFRIGHGFDLHRLEPNLPLIIGGVNIPHDRGCDAHSDGDVLLHCIVDAILGALGLPDIGQIFPDTDPKWKGAASSVFVQEAVRLMHEAGYEIGNLDATLILQRPKVSPHKESIKSNLCDLMGVHPSVVNIKAKTHEKVDSLGENRSIAAHTVVLLMKK